MSYPNMSTLMKRLEAATSRLEDLANFYETDKPTASRAPSGSHMTPVASAAASRKGSVASVGSTGCSALTSANSNSKSGPNSSNLTNQPPRYESLDALDAKLQHLLQLSKEIDTELYNQVLAFKTGYSNATNIAVLVRGVIKPDVGRNYADLFKPVNSQIEHIAQIREANYTSKFVNHFSTVAEGALILGWVSFPNPAEYVKDLKEASQFYANKVLKDYKEDPVHKEWVKEFLSFCNELHKVLEDSLPEGLQWNPKGVPLSEALKDAPYSDGKQSGASTSSVSSAATVSSSAPPPPPPTSAELNAGGEDKTANASSGGMNALFAEISQGTDIHSTLKHIDRKAISKDTPPASSSSDPSASSKPKPTKPPKPSSVKPESTTLTDNKWTIENYRDNHEIVVELEMKQTVFIENCERCTIVVKNKGTSVTLSNCKKVGIMVDTLISGLDFLGCSDCQAQTGGRLASLMLDKSNNMEIYLNEESLDVDVRTINTWSINLEIPTGEPGDYVEAPIAEQISHTIDPKTRKVKSVAVSPGQ